MNNSEYEALLNQLRKDVVPIGSILIFPSKNVPEGYLPCEGQEISIQLYTELYNLIGHTWGGGKTTFCLPDLQGQFIRGWDREGDVDPQRQLGEYQEDSFQGHSHVFDFTKLKLATSGDHDHDLYWATFQMRDASLNDFNNHTQKIPIPYASKDESQYNRQGTSYERKDGTELTGAHTHDFNIDHGSLIIGDPSNSVYGDISSKIKHETRPKNIALVFCIKAK